MKYQPAIDRSIDQALAYLARQQLPDGSFPGSPSKNAAITALATLAFLARGYVPGQYPYGETINRGVDFVLTCRQSNGTFIGPGGGQMYSHNIATLMLSEVSGMVDDERQRRIDAELPRAVKIILDAQAVPKHDRMSGGWRYEPKSTDSDISHSGWALMALRSARNNGAPVPKEAIERAVRFIEKCHGPEGGFGYQPGSGSNLARSGIALLCFELGGRHRDAITRGAATYITRNFKDKWRGDYPFYTFYYTAHSLFQLGGRDWESFAPTLYDTVLGLQTADGSWQAPGGKEAGVGRCYCTSMAVLALSVSHRVLPIYQR